MYIDDLIITNNDSSLVTQLVNILATQFSLKDLGMLSYFLGVEVIPNKHGILPSQRCYIMDLLTQTHMSDVGANCWK